jgi:hypothetical protein
LPSAIFTDHPHCTSSENDREEYDDEELARREEARQLEEEKMRAEEEGPRMMAEEERRRELDEEIRLVGEEVTYVPPKVTAYINLIYNHIEHTGMSLAKEYEEMVAHTHEKRQRATIQDRHDLKDQNKSYSWVKQYYRELRVQTLPDKIVEGFSAPNKKAMRVYLAAVKSGQGVADPAVLAQLRRQQTLTVQVDYAPQYGLPYWVARQVKLAWEEVEKKLDGYAESRDVHLWLDIVAHVAIKLSMGRAVSWEAVYEGDCDSHGGEQSHKGVTDVILATAKPMRLGSKGFMFSALAHDAAINISAICTQARGDGRIPTKLYCCEGMWQDTMYDSTLWKEVANAVFEKRGKMVRIAIGQDTEAEEEAANAAERACYNGQDNGQVRPASRPPSRPPSRPRTPAQQAKASRYTQTDVKVEAHSFVSFYLHTECGVSGIGFGDEGESITAQDEHISVLAGTCTSSDYPHEGVETFDNGGYAFAGRVEYNLHGKVKHSGVGATDGTDDEYDDYSDDGDEEFPVEEEKEEVAWITEAYKGSVRKRRESWTERKQRMSWSTKHSEVKSDLKKFERSRRASIVEEGLGDDEDLMKVAFNAAHAMDTSKRPDSDGSGSDSEDD